MGWETRSGRRYYYRKKRIGGKVVSQYIGQSAYALSAVELGSKLDQWHQVEHAEERRKLGEYMQELRQVDQAINEYGAQVRQVVAAVLQQLGYRKYKGQWRMPRKMNEQITQKVTSVEYNEFKGLLDAAEKKTAKPSDIEKARQYAQLHPRLFDGTTLIAHNTVLAILDSVKMNATGKVYLEGEAAALRRSLGEANASPLERLLIDDIAICWMRLQLIEHGYSNNTDNATFAKVEFWERRVSATRKRFLQSVESLARVRRLLSRAGVQINVAGQQVVVNG